MLQTSRLPFLDRLQGEYDPEASPAPLGGRRVRRG